jgi:hypothetical protein
VALRREKKEKIQKKRENFEDGNFCGGSLKWEKVLELIFQSTDLHYLPLTYFIRRYSLLLSSTMGLL